MTEKRAISGEKNLLDNNQISRLAVLMEPLHFSRRQLLSNLGFAATGGILTASSAQAQQNQPAAAPSALNVRDFGAAGDGVKDDTGAFAAAMKAASDTGNFAVFIPRGRYLIATRLDVPANVILEGVYTGPAGRTHEAGSVLLAVADAGNAKGEPFIMLHTSSTLRGLTIFHPEQKMKNPPVPYPWTIRGSGDNICLQNILLVNPYQGVDFGTFPSGRHSINGLYGQPLYRGLFIDQCFDVGRVENVHFWSFWGGWNGPLYEFMRVEAVAFELGQSDWEFMSHCFCIGYGTGYHFVERKTGPGNYLLMESGSDISPNAVRVENSQAHAGISFVNCQFMAGIQIAHTNRGPVKFTACGFWGVPTTDDHALLDGTGHTFFTACHFITWGQQDHQAAAIHARRGGLTVTACDFMDAGKTQIIVEPDVDAAMVYGNRLRGSSQIINRAGDRAQIALNAVSPS
ncbi:MAG TPA: glycosyl hydrolase family 28-related protein [Verrucomicrobiae bacterium]